MNKKKLLALLMALVMTLTLVPVTAFAEGNVAKIGDTEYATLADAIAAVPTDGNETTIQMIADSAETGTITIGNNQNVVLDLAGHEISYTENASGKSVYFLTNKGMLTIQDTSENGNGNIVFTATPNSTSYSYETVTIYNLGGTLNFASGKITNASGGGLAYAVNNSSNAWGSDVISTFNMTGGTISAPNGDAALRVYQNCAIGSVLSKNYVNISGGTIYDTGIFVDTYLYTTGKDATNYEGNNIETIVNIEGGTINGLVDLKIRHPFHTSLNISGGNFSDSKLWVRKVASEYATAGSITEPAAPMVNISGGKWSFVDGKAFGLAYDCGATSWTSYTQPYYVTGGVFNVDLNEYNSIEFEEGKTGIANTDADTYVDYPHTVGVETPTYVAEVYDGDVKKDEFESLAEAFTFAQDNNYRDVVLVNNVTVESPISIADEAEICLNIGNHTITAKTTEARPFVLNEDSSLTVNAESNGGMIIPETETNVYGFFRVQGAGAELVLNGGGYTNSSTDANAMIRVLNNGNTLTHSVRIEMNDLAVSGIQIIRDDTCAGHPNYAQYGDLSNKLAVNGGSYVLHNNGINVGGSITGFVLQYVDSSFTNVTMTSDIGACVELDGGKAQFVGNSFAVNNANSIQGWNATTIGISYNAEATIKSGTYTSARDGIAIFSHGGRYVIEGGNITGNSSSIKTYYQDGSYSVAISGGNLKGALDFESHTVGSLTGGFYSVEPNEALVAAPYAVVASGISEYPWTIGVKLNENTTVTQDSISSVTVSDTIVPDTTMRDAIISNTTVSGVELTLTETVGTGDDAKSGLQAVIDAAKSGNNVLENETTAVDAIKDASIIDVQVDVQVTPTAYSNTESSESATFSLKPVATVTVKDSDGNKTAKIENVTVENDMIDQNQDIQVQLYTGFRPAQIIHREDNNGSIIEVFNEGDFDYKDGVVTLVVHHFSELEATAQATVPTVSFKGASLRRRVLIGTDNVVNTSSDIRFTYEWTNPQNQVLATEYGESYFEWRIAGQSQWKRVNIARYADNNASLVIEGVPYTAFETVIETRVHLQFDGGVGINLNGEDRTVKQVATALAGLTDTTNYAEWIDYGNFLLGTGNIQYYTLVRDEYGVIKNYYTNLSGN